MGNMIGREATQLAFDALGRRGLLKKNGKLVSPKKFWASLQPLACPELVSIAEELTDYLRLPNTDASSNTERSFSTHRASLLLGGSPIHHIDSGCRLFEIEQLSRFALLYSDKVYINNFFGRYAHVTQAEDTPQNRQTLRGWLLDDIFLFGKLKPLLLDEKIVMISPPQGVCPACWSLKGLGNEISRKMNKLCRHLQDEFLQQGEVTFRHTDSGYLVELKLPEYLSPHSQLWTQSLETVPKAMEKRPLLLRKLQEGQSITASMSLARELGTHKEFVKSAIHNLSFDVFTSRFINASFVTNSEMDVELLSAFTRNQEIDRRNALARKFLTSEVPFLEDWDVESVIKLRHREAEAFARFRKGLNIAINEVLNADSEFNQRTAQQLYGDVIAPRLKELDQRVRIARRTLLKDVYRPSVALVGVISIGLFLNLIPSNWADLIKLIGIGKASCDILESALALGDAHETIEQEDFYFLWKVRQRQMR